MARPKKSHCPRGHAYEEGNIKWSKNANGTYSMKCKKCNRLRGIWRKMFVRCYKASPKDRTAYQDKGIKVCDEWHDFSVFELWALENGYSHTLSIDRIDNDKGYCPENCRWATQKEQANNKTTNHPITAFGKTKNLQQWADSVGMGHKTILYRIRSGWSAEEALTIKPIMGGNKGVLR